MISFLSLYRGETIGSAKLVALSSDPTVIGEFADRLLNEPMSDADPVLAATSVGKRTALQIVRNSINQEPSTGSTQS